MFSYYKILASQATLAAAPGSAAAPRGAGALRARRASASKLALARSKGRNRCHASASDGRGCSPLTAESIAVQYLLGGWGTRPPPQNPPGKF